jgi:hypothetical protein
MQENEIDELLKCDVCKDVLYDSKTLLCQHTFCTSCIISLKECPMCRLKLYTPVKNNKLINDLVGVLYGEDKIKELQDKTHHERIEKELRPIIIEEMSSNINNTLHDSQNNLVNDQPRINNNNNPDPNHRNNLNPFQNPNQYQENVYIMGYNIKSILKYIEIGFLLYYLYGFIMSLRYGVHWMKLAVNLIVIVQASYALFLNH